MAGWRSYLFALLFLCVRAEHVEDMELKMANVLYRHGDRSPVATFPKDEHINFWKQGLGQLTEIGMGQEFRMGQFLKTRYVSKLLNGTYLKKQVYCRSSDRDRTIMSAEAQMAGLYPPKYKEPLPDEKYWQFWQLVPIHTVPVQYDKLLRSTDANCPRYKELYNKSVHEPEYVNLEKKYKKFIENVSKDVGTSLTLRTVTHVYDMLFCQRAHNLTWPAWVTPEAFATLKLIHKYIFGWLFNSPEKSRLTGGPLLGEMIQNMKNFRTNPGTSKKLHVYSAHDTTVVALLSALGIYSGIPPPYSTAFLMELYYNKNSKDYHVQMFYRNDTSEPDKAYGLSLHDCQPPACTLDKFINQTARAVPVDYDAECHVTPKRDHCQSPCKDNSSSDKTCKDTLTAVVIILVLVFVAFVGFAVKRCQTKRKNSARSQFRQIRPDEWDSDQ